MVKDASRRSKHTLYGRDSSLPPSFPRSPAEIVEESCGDFVGVALERRRADRQTSAKSENREIGTTERGLE